MPSRGVADRPVLGFGRPAQGGDPSGGVGQGGSDIEWKIDGVRFENGRAGCSPGVAAPTKLGRNAAWEVGTSPIPRTGSR